MSLWAVIPVKSFNSGKSRMRALLETSEREALNRRFLTHTLETLQAVREVEIVVVVSKDAAVLELAEKFSALPLRETPGQDLNSALEQARQEALARKIGSLLVLPTDLPGIRPQDVTELIASLPGPPSIAIAPDRHRRGTNALLLSPPGLIPFAFGLSSFHKHCENAQSAGAAIAIVENYRLALDIDERDDLLIAAAPLMNEDIIQSISTRKFE